MNYLFLDDERVPMQAYYLTNDKIYMAYTWDIVRNYDQFTTYIETHGLPKLISFDHDLADEHYKIGAEEEFLGFDYNKVIRHSNYFNYFINNILTEESYSFFYFFFHNLNL